MARLLQERVFFYMANLQRLNLIQQAKSAAQLLTGKGKVQPQNNLGKRSEIAVRATLENQARGKRQPNERLAKLAEELPQSVKVASVAAPTFDSPKAKPYVSLIGKPVALLTDLITPGFVENRFPSVPWQGNYLNTAMARFTQPGRSAPEAQPEQQGQGWFSKFNQPYKISGKATAATSTPIPSPTLEPTGTPPIQPTAVPQPTVAPTEPPQKLPTYYGDAPEEDLVKRGVRKEFTGLVDMYGKMTGIGSRLASGILLNENRSMNPQAVNRNNAPGVAPDFGLWQLNGIEEYDPVKNTERAAAILNNKRTRLKQILGGKEPAQGLLVEAYNKGADGAVFGVDPNYTYAKKAFENAGVDWRQDPFLANPRGYLSQFGY